MFHVTYIDCRGDIEVIKCTAVDYSNDKYLVCKEDIDEKSYIVKALIPHDKVRHIIFIKN